MILKGVAISSKQFTVYPNEDGPEPTVYLVAEASDLSQPEHQVWDDACDVGFTIRSERTGEEVTFARDHEERDREGDLLYIDYQPCEPRYRGLFAARVFND